MPHDTILRKDASLLYNAWALENGVTVAWERLTNRQQQAWLIVVDLANDGLDSSLLLEPKCDCGRPLTCSVCDDFNECPRCGRWGHICCDLCSFQALCIGESR